MAALTRAQGWEAGPGRLGKITGEIRRVMSVTVVRANAECLLEHLSQLGPGASAAAKWQQSALQLEDRRRWDKQAFDLSWRERGHLRLAGLLSSFLSLAVNSSMISPFITNVSPWSIQCIYAILFDKLFLLTSIFLYDTWLLLLPFFFNSGSLLPLRMKHV